MNERTFHLVDVFADRPFQGNQLAVFTHGHRFSEEEMARLATEFNFSEISFVFPEESTDDTFKVRIFTPAEEVPFAGHPTLGTAFVIIRELLRRDVPELTLDLPAGKIRVSVAYRAPGEIETLTMRQLEPAFGAILEPGAAAAVLGLPEEAIDSRYPVEEVSTGLPFLIIPLRRLVDLSEAAANRQSWSVVSHRFGAKGVLAFCPGARSSAHQLSVRVFVPDLGISEDPATGSANGCLVGYLLKHAYLGPGPLSLWVEQGFDMGRPSLLHLAGRAQGGRMVIEVGGKVVPMATGRLIAQGERA